jgi:small GTP-binding protein
MIKSLGSQDNFKVVVLGDQGTGKTCLVLRYIEGQYCPSQESTIGAFYLQKKVSLKDGRAIKMQLWDTAGQERFRAMAPMYYRNAAVAIICFDITNEESFVKMKEWVEELHSPANRAAEGLIMVIACTKCDLEFERVVSRSRAEEFAQRVNATLFETSAKDNSGVNELFRCISEQVIKSKGFVTRVDSIASGLRPVGHVLDAGPLPNKYRKGCC